MARTHRLVRPLGGIVSGRRATVRVGICGWVGAAALGLVLVGVGCSERVIGRGGGVTVPPEEREAAARIDHDAYATLGYRVQWRGFPTMTSGAVLRRLDVLGDLVVAQDSASVVSAIETTTGRSRWSDQLGNPLTKFVGSVRDGNRVICSSETDAFYLDADTGNLVAKHGLEMVVSTRPILAANILIYGTASGELLGLMKGTGYRVWGNSVQGGIDESPVAMLTAEGAENAGAADVAGVVSQSGEVLLFNTTSGSGRGRAKIAGGVTVPAAASDGLLFVASLDQSIYAFDASSANQVWRYRTDAPLHERPVYHEGRLYCHVASRGLVCFEAPTGKIIWSTKDVSGYVVGMRNGRLIVWDGPGNGGRNGGGTAWSLDPANGQIIEQHQLAGVSFMSVDAFVDGNLYTGTPSGVVTKFVAR
ncbi:MAG: PQQ-binding-like beta-propeller repeat protein [Phycisphaerales bacterium]|nr:PQQ-binding-like beta-propeller repeat protein [Phycisphaerales bacterium]